MKYYILLRDTQFYLPAVVYDIVVCMDSFSIKMTANMIASHHRLYHLYIRYIDWLIIF